MLYEKNFMKEKEKTQTQKNILLNIQTDIVRGKKLIDILVFLFIQNQSFHLLLNLEKKKKLTIYHFQ